MFVLIELYDGKVPFNNFLTCRLLRPDRLIMLMPEEERDLTRVMEQFENFKRVFSLHTQAIYKSCSTRDILETVDNLKQIISEYGEENCVIDTVGGNEMLLLAAGICIPDHPAIRVTGMQGSLPVWVWGEAQGHTLKKNSDLTVREIISIAAGELKAGGHVNRRDIDPYLKAGIPEMFGIYLKHREIWPDFTAYLQRLNTWEYTVRKGAYRGPAKFRFSAENEKIVAADETVLRDLKEAWILKAYTLDEEECTLEFNDPSVIPLLCITGSWVELFVYYAMEKSGLFSDIEIDSVISWDNDEDNDDTTNEVDVLAVRGVVPVFVSCKSGPPSTNAVNEILAITSRFGNSRAKAILVTASKTVTDAPAARKRASESGVIIIDQQDLNTDAFRRIFRSLFPQETAPE